MAPIAPWKWSTQRLRTISFSTSFLLIQHTIFSPMMSVHLDLWNMPGMLGVTKTTRRLDNPCKQVISHMNTWLRGPHHSKSQQSGKPGRSRGSALMRMVDLNAHLKSSPQPTMLPVSWVQLNYTFLMDFLLPVSQHPSWYHQTAQTADLMMRQIVTRTTYTWTLYLQLEDPLVSTKTRMATQVTATPSLIRVMMLLRKSQLEFRSSRLKRRNTNINKTNRVRNVTKPLQMRHLQQVTSNGYKGSSMPSPRRRIASAMLSYLGESSLQRKADLKLWGRRKYATPNSKKKMYWRTRSLITSLQFENDRIKVVRISLSTAR